MALITQTCKFPYVLNLICFGSLKTIRHKFTLTLIEISADLELLKVGYDVMDKKKSHSSSFTTHSSS